MTSNWTARAISIDPTAKTVTEVRCGTFSDLAVLLGGDILLVVTAALPAGNTLYCHADAMFDPDSGFFTVTGDPWPVGRRGVIVGCECWDGDDLHYQDALSSVEEVVGMVRFLTDIELSVMAASLALAPRPPGAVDGNDMLYESGDESFSPLADALLQHVTCNRALLHPGHGSRSKRAALRAGLH